MFANTPKPPYYAVIFTARTKEGEFEGYAETSRLMRELAEKEEGFLGIESVGEREEITVSYWRDLEAIHSWKHNTDHQIAKAQGRKDWYERYISRIARVEKEYGFEKGELTKKQINK